MEKQKIPVKNVPNSLRVWPSSRKRTVFSSKQCLGIRIWRSIHKGPSYLLGRQGGEDSTCPRFSWTCSPRLGRLRIPSRGIWREPRCHLFRLLGTTLSSGSGSGHALVSDVEQLVWCEGGAKGGRGVDTTLYFEPTIISIMYYLIFKYLLPHKGNTSYLIKGLDF